jgi:hypothetical protein
MEYTKGGDKIVAFLRGEFARFSETYVRAFRKWTSGKGEVHTSGA